MEAREERDKVRPAPPTHSPDGVDLTLIRSFLALTPRERLEFLQQAANSLEKLRAAKKTG